MESAAREQLHILLLTEDLKTYRSLENWGATLFLTAIAALGKQLLEWDQPTAPTTLIVSPSMASMPGLAGLLAFVFLRIINFRTSRTWMALYEAAVPRGRHWGVGWLGWFIALMPLVLGLLLSWMLAKDPLRTEWMRTISLASFAAFSYSVFIHFRARRETT